MKISELQSYLNKQKELHGDVNIFCTKAFGSIVESGELMLDDLLVTTRKKVCEGEDSDEKIITIGYDY
ncbi:hypothetical protein [Dickeya sp. NCPPB 3274]|uniref:hypothetical protein n=1 Tax=Dickeya sp. NCPPB 3274 TaxID=568766 RepID=UPI00126854A2|nr:hypothetical protein [Dickeya sp. NCPPB 3274]